MHGLYLVGKLSSSLGRRKNIYILLSYNMHNMLKYYLIKLCVCVCVCLCGVV